MRPDIEGIAARAEKATPGPWKACGTDPRPTGELPLSHAALPTERHQHGACTCGFVWSVATDSPVLEVIGGAWGDTWPTIRVREDGQLEPCMDRCDYGEVPRADQAANMKFIETARTDIPALIAYIKEIEGENTGLKKRLRAALRDTAERNVIAIRGSRDVPGFEICVQNELDDLMDLALSEKDKGHE